MSLLGLVEGTGGPLESVLMLVGLVSIFLILDRFFLRLALEED